MTTLTEAEQILDDLVINNLKINQINFNFH